MPSRRWCRSGAWAAVVFLAAGLSASGPEAVGEVFPVRARGAPPAASLFVRLRGGGFHKSRKVRKLNNWKPKHKREGENPLQIHKAHRMRKKEKDHAVSERKVRNVMSSVKMQDREQLYAAGVLETPEVNSRFIRNQRVRAEAALPAREASEDTRARMGSVQLFGDDDDEDASELHTVDRQTGAGASTTAHVNPPVTGEITDINEWIGPVSEFTDDSVDEFLRRHPEAAVSVKFVDDDRPAACQAVFTAACEDKQKSALDSHGEVRKSVDGNTIAMSTQAGTSRPEEGTPSGCGGEGKRQNSQAADVCAGGGKVASHQPCGVDAGNRSAAGESEGKSNSKMLTYAKGERVLYRSGNGTLLEVGRAG
jgi:hypothetical protein